MKFFNLCIYSLMASLLLFVGVNKGTAQLAESPWPKVGQNALNTNFSPFEGPQKDSIKWTYGFPRISNNSPVIGPSGNIYIGSEGYNFLVFHNDGSLKWKYTVKGEDGVTSPAISKDSVLYFGAHNQKIFAFTLDGDLLWTYKTDGYRITESPTIGSDGTIYVGSVADGLAIDGNLYAIAPSGTLKWKIHRPNYISGTPAIMDNGAVIFASDSSVYVANSQGHILWNFSTNSWIKKGTPAVDSQGNIYIGNVGGMVYSLALDGTLNWKYKAGDTNLNDPQNEDGKIGGTPAILGDSLLYVVSARNSYSADSGYVHSFRLDGTLRWEREIEGISGFTSPTVDKNGNVYVGANFGITALNSKGDIIWHNDVPVIGHSSAAISSDGTLYISGLDSTFYSIGNSTSVDIPPIVRSVPSNYSLQPNYPNPFNPVTTISYRLPQVSQVTLEVYNIMGKRIATLVDGKRGKGEHKVKFDAGGLSSGIYIYRLKADDFSQSRRMLLIK